MLRLSRLRDVVLIAIAFAIWGVAEACSIYLFVLNRRVTRELVQHTWREPVIVYGKGDAEVTRLYGADWRPMPLVSIQTVPKYVGNAFIAAEDVRFRHHIGVDPIGMMRAL
jgi:penicillin-binding protein 1A